MNTMNTLKYYSKTNNAVVPHEICIKKRKVLNLKNPHAGCNEIQPPNTGMLTVRVRSCGKVQLGPWLGSKWTLDTDRGCNWGWRRIFTNTCQVWKSLSSAVAQKSQSVGPTHTGQSIGEPCKTKDKTSMESWGTRQGSCSYSLSRLRGNSSSVPAQSQSHQYHQCTPACTKVTCLKAAIHHQLPQEQHIWLCLYQRLSEEYGLILPPKSVTMRWPLVGNFLDLSGLPNLYMRLSWLTVQRAWGINRHAAELNSQFN